MAKKKEAQQRPDPRVVLQKFLDEKGIVLSITNREILIPGTNIFGHERVVSVAYKNA